MLYLNFPVDLPAHLFGHFLIYLAETDNCNSTNNTIAEPVVLSGHKQICDHPYPEN